MVKVSEKDTFIEEVSEELRKDRLIKFIKKYLWVIILILLLIICVIGLNEYRKNNISNNNQRNGDIIYNFLTIGDEESFKNLKLLASKNDIESVVPKFILSQRYIELNDIENAKGILNSIVSLKNVSKDLSDLAKIYLFFLENDNLIKEKFLKDLNSPNNSFRLIALEQKVYILIENKEFSEANKLINLILNDIEVSNSLKQRVKNIQKVISQKL